MPTLMLKLTLLDDVVASERPATEGGHTSLDYLPGAMLLGAAAARLYSKLSRGEAYTLFHSGRVRFGDGLPLANKAPGWPMPLCWHARKGESPTNGQRLDAAKVRNLQCGRFPDGAQPKQLREGHIRADGYRLTVRQTLRMKTAIDPDTGRVAESQLFGYEAIQAGQSFLTRIEADDDVPEPLWANLTGVLGGSGELLLGRSRSTEFGRVRAEPLDSSAAPAFLPVSGAASQEVTLWCLADLALLDAWGQPTLAPSPQALGVSRGRVDWERSFLRFRRYAPWNAYRCAYDLERQVIRRGSIITLTDVVPPLTDAERSRLTAGIGVHREAGLGQVSVDPQLLAGPAPVFAAPMTTQPTGTPVAPGASHPLITWLTAGQAGSATRSAAEQQARAQAKALAERYRLARAFIGLAANQPIGPSPAQWGSIYEQARTADDLVALRQALFAGDNALCKPRGEGWQDQFRDETGDETAIRSFFDWLQAVATDQLQSVQALRVFGREAQRIAQREHGRAGHERTST
ncbi:MAG: hypothetical protein RKO66_18265 [Candidatus Contendobacter sp.]|nr:hypothetical protein [Candidatus Contendobacter sp.]MDS4059537.1 hypothetical protein [Candidatus Contendobacter sp.]